MCDKLFFTRRLSMSVFVRKYAFVTVLLLCLLAVESAASQKPVIPPVEAPKKELAPVEGQKQEKLIHSKDVKTLALGSSAPDFKLPAVDGKYYSLENFESKDVLVIIFTCNHCPTAQAYEDRVIQLVKDYKKKSVAIVAISPNDPLAVSLAELGYSDLNDSYIEMRIRAMMKKYNFPYLYDGDDQKVSAAYGPKTTPHVFIFDKERNLRYVGRIDDSEKIESVKVHDTRNAIDALLGGTKVRVKHTNTIGCSIKWSGKRKNVMDQWEKWAQETATLKSIQATDIKGIMKNDTKNYRLLNLWATWCGPCIMEFPEIINLHRMYRNRNFEIVTLSLDFPSAKETAVQFLNKYNASFTNYIYNSEDRYAFSAAIGNGWSGTLPHTFLIAPGGKIIYTKAGMLDPLTIRGEIVNALGRYYD